MPPWMTETAVVLLSGGMDSATALAMTIKEGHDVIGLTFDYGQRHRKEIEAAKRIAAHFRVKDHRVATMDLSAIGGSALADAHIRVPEQRRIEEIGREIPITYVPARNTILLAYALGLAEAAGAKSIVIAANQVDYSGYPDCRPEYYAAFQEVARLGTKRGVEGDVIEIRTPLIRLSKADIVRTGEELGVPWALTWSCYHGRAKACGVCDSCQLRRKGLRQASADERLSADARIVSDHAGPRDGRPPEGRGVAPQRDVRLGPRGELARRTADRVHPPVCLQPPLPMVRLHVRRGGGRIHEGPRGRRRPPDPRALGLVLRGRRDPEHLLDRRRAAPPGRVHRGRDSSAT